MDTSETYIKMRLAAIPDLGIGCKPRTPFHYITDSVQVDAKGDFYYSNAKDELFQLERQDQLLEMVCKDWGLQTICTRIEEFSKASEGGVSITIGGSMEQLWLAFVQKQNHNKVWRGDKWEV